MAVSMSCVVYVEFIAVDLVSTLLRDALGAAHVEMVIQDQVLIFIHRHFVRMSHDISQTGVTRPTSPTESSSSPAYCLRTMQPRSPLSPVSNVWSGFLDPTAPS